MKKPSVKQVTAVLELLARYHPAGLGVLTGAVAAPDASELSELITCINASGGLGIRIQGGEKVYEAERKACTSNTISSIIDEIGGWKHVWEAACSVQDGIAKNLWSEMADFVAHIVPGGMIHDGEGGMGAKLFRTGKSRHGISERTARRRFHRIMRIIAIKILSVSPSGDLQLLSSTDGGFPK